MEYLTLLGEAAYTASAARKIQDLINKTKTAKVDEVSAVYVHYAHLKETRDGARVSNNISIFSKCLAILFASIRVVVYPSYFGGLFEVMISCGTLSRYQHRFKITAIADFLRKPMQS